MKDFLKYYWETWLWFLEEYFEEPPLISREVQRILAHPEDRVKYLAMQDKFRDGSKEETIVLHTGEELTIVCHSVRFL